MLHHSVPFCCSSHYDFSIFFPCKLSSQTFTMWGTTYYFIMSFISRSLIAANNHKVFTFDYWDPICSDTLDLNENYVVHYWVFIHVGRAENLYILDFFFFFNKTTFIDEKLKWLKFFSVICKAQFFFNFLLLIVNIVTEPWFVPEW